MKVFLHSSLGFVLAALLTARCFGAAGAGPSNKPNDKNLKPAELLTQNYGVIDLSRGVTNGKPVTQVALNDSGVGAFGFWDGDNQMPTSAGANTKYHIYPWNNGLRGAELNSADPIAYASYAGYNTQEQGPEWHYRNIKTITSSGAAYGEEMYIVTADPTSPPPGNYRYCSALYGVDYPHYPPFHTGWAFNGQSIGVSFTAVSENGIVAGRINYTTNQPFIDPYEWDYQIYVGSDFTPVFTDYRDDMLIYFPKDAAAISTEDIGDTITSINKLGHFTSQGSPSGNSYFCDGSKHSLGPCSDCLLNEQNDVIASTNSEAGGFFWRNNVKSVMADQLTGLPFKQIKRVVPIALSNQDATTHDVFVLTKASVIKGGNPGSFEADVLLVWRIPQSGSWDCKLVGLPSDVDMTKLTGWKINSSGNITAIGNAGHGDGHALLLMPIDVVSDTNNNHSVDPTDEVLKYVRFGLWDHAFDSDVVTSNFVGDDGRRFYLRVSGPLAKLASTASGPTAAKSIVAYWYTKNATTDAVDDYPANATITLTETTTGSGIFASKGLMLVSDNVDYNQPTNTGLGTNTSAGRDEADHRTRRATLDDKMCFDFYFGPAGTPPATFSIPIFNPATDSSLPDAIKTLNVQIVNTTGGSTGYSGVTPDYIDGIKLSIAQRFAVAGVKVQISYDPAHDFLNIPATTPIDLAHPKATPIDLGSIATASLYPETGALHLIIDDVRSKYGPISVSNHTVYLIMIGGFSDVDKFNKPFIRGVSFTNTTFDPVLLQVNPWLSNAIYCSVIAQSLATSLTTSHEIGHQLLNRILPMDTNNGGHYGGNDSRHNLMCNSPEDTGTTTASKRLWNDEIHAYTPLIDEAHKFQIDYLRGSGLLY